MAALALMLVGASIAGAAEAAQDLYLEVWVNGLPMNLITRFTDHGDGVLSADAGELRNSGVMPDGGARSGEVRLDAIPGLGWRLIAAEQTIRFVVPDALVAPRVISAGATPAEDEPQIDRAWGAVLNYGLAIDGVRGLGQTVSGNFDARLSMPVGALTHRFAVTGGDDRLRRMDSFWRSDFPGHAVQLQIGDVTTRGPGWSRPVRLGGVMAERNFALRPDLVTTPLPGFAGRASLPSTIEVFSGQFRTYSAELPAGPFRIEDLPLAGQGGMARVVLRDVTGQETVTDMPFLVSDALLRPGTVDFAIAAGQARLGIVTDTDHYRDERHVIGTARAGARDDLTIMAHVEAGPGLRMAGLGATARLAHWGTATLSHARSSAALSTGSLTEVSADLAFGRVRLAGRLLGTEGDFADVASVTADTDADAGFPRRLARLSLSAPLGERGSGALVFSALSQPDGMNERTLGLSLAFQLGKAGSLSLTGVAQHGRHADHAISAQLHIPLGRNRNVSALTQRRRDQWRHSVSASGRSAKTLPGWEWRLQADGARETGLAGRVAHSGQMGRFELAGRLAQDHAAAALRIEGAVVAAGGGVFLSRRIDDAFAIVDAGAPGIEVHAENRPVGRTGRSGRILVPDLRAYEANVLSIDPVDLPLDAVLDQTRMTVRPAHHSGSRVDFGVRAEAQEAVISLVDARGEPVEVGGEATLNGATDPLLVGFDGEVFALGLKPRNRMQVSYPDGRGCIAEFDYVDQRGTITRLEKVPCL